jgi:hypothetical protein
MSKLAAAAERIVQVCAALGAFIFLLSGVVYLYQGRWGVTLADYWRIYDFCLNHTWLESALHKHFEHSLFFPSFFWLADLQFFRGSQLALFLAGLALLFLSAALLLISVWRDKTVGLTAKMIATLVVIAGNFWAARSAITASGGFNVICSLVVASALLAFLLLPKKGMRWARPLSAMLIVVSAAFVSSFSFGAGLATWPALLFLMWSLRLKWQAFVPVGIAVVATIVIYQELPPYLPGQGAIDAIETVASAGLGLGPQLCRLAGSPFFYAASGWNWKPLSIEAAVTSKLSLWCGIAGLGVAAVALVFAIIRRDLANSPMKFIGMALVAFNLTAMALAVAANRTRGHGFEFQFMAPRYLFWTTLFWVGLLLVAIQYTESRRWIRWPNYLLALLLAGLMLPSHYKSAVYTRFARVAAESAAIGLVTGVRDDAKAKILWLFPNQVYRVAEQLRLRRLDMFADGLQDWIGQPGSKLFDGRSKREDLRGECLVVRLVKKDGMTPAAQVRGWIKKREHMPRLIRRILAIPTLVCGDQSERDYTTVKTLMIVDQAGVVRGLARSSAMDPFINCFFYFGSEPEAFAGYIRDYDPQVRYTIRDADDRILSEEAIPVEDQISAAKPR